MLGNILVGISGITWTIVYIELIRKGYKEKACGMPLFALTLNFAWETIYGLDGLFFSKSFITVQSIANVAWAVCDIFVLSTWCKFGKQYMTENSKKYFVPFTILAIIASFATQFAFYFGCETVTKASIYSAYAQNVAMSIMFLYMLFQRKDTKAQSMTIAVCKCVGTLTPTIYGCLNGINIFILITGIVCFVFDLIYIYFLNKFQKENKQVA